jgi:hypothetical protein
VTSVVLHAVEFTWLREMLALNAASGDTCELGPVGPVKRESANSSDRSRFRRAELPGR